MEEPPQRLDERFARRDLNRIQAHSPQLRYQRRMQIGRAHV
jgi:hypothetical protein